MPHLLVMNARHCCLLFVVLSTAPAAPAPAATPPATDQRPELALQLGHSLVVRSLAFSPDGSTLVSAANDGTIRLWDAETHDLVRTLAGHSAPVTSVAFAPNGKSVGSGSQDGTAKIWSAGSGQLLRTLRLPRQRIFSIAFSPDGKTLAAGSGEKPVRNSPGTVTLWDVSTGVARRTLTNKSGAILTIAFSSDATTVAGGAADNSVRLWDAQTGTLEKTLEGHNGAVTSIAYAVDRKTIASGSTDGTIRLWDAGTGQLQQMLVAGIRATTADKVHANIRAVAFAPDGRTVAGANLYGTVQLWDAQSGALKLALRNRQQGTYALAFSPDGTTLADNGSDTITLWNVATGERQAVLSGRGRVINSLAFAPDGKTLATSGQVDDTIHLWDATTGGLQRAFSQAKEAIHAVAYSPDSKTIASGGATHVGRTGSVLLWSVQDGRLQRRLLGHKHGVEAIAFSRDGKLLASGGGSIQKSNHTLAEIKLWNAQTGKLLRSWTGREGTAAALAFSPDNKTLASGTYWTDNNVQTGTIQLWDVRTGKLLRTLAGHTGWVSSVKFSPDGKTLVSGSRDRTLRLWDTRNGKLLRTLKGHTDWVRSVDFSPDGKTLVSGSSDKTIRLWDVRTGRQLRLLRGHEFGVKAVDFSPDGKRLASGGRDTTTRVWDVSSGRELAKLLTAPSDDPELNGPAWLAVTPEGYYHCSEGADYLFKWRFRSRLVPFYRFEETYRRPDIIRRALRRERIAARPLTLARVPPTCWILSPEPGMDMARDSVRVLVGVTDDDATPIDVNMYVNGILVPESIAKSITADAKPILADGKDIFGYARAAAAEANTANAKPIVAVSKPITAEGKPIVADGKQVPPEHQFSRIVSVDIVLPPGEKDLNLRAVIYDSEKNKYDAAVTIRRTDAKPIPRDLYVLCVGVSQYRNPNYNLNFAAADANAIATLFQAQQGGEYTRVHTTVLTNRQATAKVIRAALEDLQKKARSLDTVMVFLSGHGVQSKGKSYFAPWGIFIHEIETTCLPWSEIMQTLSNVYAKKLLFTDACHSGDRLGPSRATGQHFIEAARRRTGIVMLSSSQGNEVSFEERPLQHGAFTVALLEAFNGKADVDGNSIITLPELALYVPKRVNALTKGLQNPHLVLVQDFNPQTPLARVPAAHVARRDGG